MRPIVGIRELCAALLAMAACGVGAADQPPPRPWVLEGHCGLDAWGKRGGPFVPGATRYTLTNRGPAPLKWTATKTQPWVALSAEGGTLAPGATETIAVELSPKARELAAGVHDDVLTIADAAAPALTTTRALRLTVTQAPEKPMKTARRTEGVAPLAVFFDAVGSASDVVQPPGDDPDHAAFHYRWDFGDPESGAWPDSGRSRNASTGWLAAHVYERPGKYEARLRVVDVEGEVHTYRQEVVVQDPETVYRGRTLYVSDASGDDKRPGTSPDAPLRTLSKALKMLFESDGPRRLLLKRGETHAIATPFETNFRKGPYTIGAYGQGAAPVVSVVHDKSGLHFLPDVSDVRVVDLDIAGPHPKPAGEGVQLGRDSLLHRCTVRGFRIAVGAHHEFCNGDTVSECELLGNKSYGLYWSPGHNPAGPDDPPIHLAVIGNRFDGTEDNSLLRAYVSRSLWQANRFQRAGASTVRLMGSHTPKKSELNVIADNSFESNQPWVLEIGPENDENGAGNGAQQVVTDVLLEGNRFSVPKRESLNRYVLIWARDVTVRNNVFDHTGTRADATILVGRRGIGPEPTGIRVDHNTAFGTGASSYAFVQSTGQERVLVRNNVVSGPARGTQVATGPADLGENLTSDPGFESAPARDLRLRAGSPALERAAPLPVRSDFDGNPRPLRARADLGAFERP